MAKFKLGELAVLLPHPLTDRQSGLKKYQGRIVEVHQYVGIPPGYNVPPWTGFKDYYIVVSDDDGYEFYADETVLEKLPYVKMPATLTSKKPISLLRRLLHA